MSTIVFLTAIVAILVVIVWCVQNDKAEISNKGNKGFLAMEEESRKNTKQTQL